MNGNAITASPIPSLERTKICFTWALLMAVAGNAFIKSLTPSTVGCCNWILHPEGAVVEPGMTAFPICGHLVRCVPWPSNRPTITNLRWHSRAG